MRRGHAGTSHRLGDSGSWIVEPNCAKGIKPKIAGSRHSLSFVKSTAFAPSWTPLRVSSPPPYKLIMRVRKPHGLSEVRLAVNRRATTEWQYLSEPVTATPGLTYWTNSPEFFASRSFWCFGAGEKSSWRAHVFSAGEELIPSRMFGHAG